MNWQGLFLRLARLASRNAHRLIPSEPLGRDEPVPARPTDNTHLRLHLFGAHFDSLADARAFCYATAGPELPVALTRELEGAFIDTDEVEVVHGEIAARLAEFLTPNEADDIILRLADDNTLIILTENAFGGLPYDLNDTDHLTYLGPQIVAI